MAGSKRDVQVSDIVDAILDLESAPLVTGEILHVDGGQTAGHLLTEQILARTDR